MAKTYMGLDCIANMSSTEYKKLHTISQAQVPYAYQANYALFLVYFGVVLLFLLIIKKMLYMYNDYSTRTTGSNKISFPFINKLSALSRYLSYKRLPLIFSRITGLPPSFGTLFLFFASTLFILCYAFIPHYWYRECRGFGSAPLAVRTGLMVMGLTPFLYIISGKTNFISGVTGVSYEKLNVFHQGLGWASFFLSMVHTVPFLIQDVEEGGISRLHHQWNAKEIYRNGVPPLVLLFFLTFGGSRFIRKYMYEAFWHLHWIMGLAYFGTLAWHVYGHMGIEYIWGTLGFWAAQILYRIIVKSPFKPNTYAFKHKEATVKGLPNDLYEINIPIKEHYEFFWKPGQHIFIRFMNGIHTLDNHPFSVLTSPSISGKSNLKLIVRPQRGLTKKIYDNILNEKNLEKKYKVYIDGAYGGMNRDSLAFEKLIMVSSGTGIAVTLPFMIHLSQNLLNPTNCVKSTDFIWVVNSIDSLEWIKDQLIEILNNVINVDSKSFPMFNFNIFVTNSKENPQGVQLIKSRNELIISEKSQSSDGSDNSNTSKESFAQTSVVIDETNYRNYLNIYMRQKPLLNKYIAETPLLTKNAVIVSGTSSLQVEVGNGVAELQKEIFRNAGGVDEVYLHTENFGW